MKKITIALVIFLLVAAAAWLCLWNGIGSYKSLVLAAHNTKNV